MKIASIRRAGLCLALLAAPVSAQPADAEAQLRSHIERTDSVRARLQLARLLASGGDAAGALETLRGALERAGNSEEVLYTTARVALQADTPVTAILALEPLSRMHPTVAEYAYLLGVARLQVADWAGSVEALEQAHELAPGRAITLVGLGLAFNGQKRFAEARDALERSLQLDPEAVEALAALAEAEEGLGEIDAAEAHAEQALARDPDHATAHVVLGMIRLEQGRHEEAREALERAVAQDPGSPRAQYQLSLAYARLGDADRSAHHLDLYRQALDAYEAWLQELGGGGTGGM